MDKTIIYLIIGLLLIGSVFAINYQYLYNPYTGKRDRTLKNISDIKGDINWTSNQNYPVACPSGSAITLLNDSVTCTSYGTYNTSSEIFTAVNNGSFNPYLGNSTNITCTGTECYYVGSTGGGGSATANGSAGEVQFATGSGTFGADGNLTWDNENKKLEAIRFDNNDEKYLIEITNGNFYGGCSSCTTLTISEDLVPSIIEEGDLPFGKYYINVTSGGGSDQGLRMLIWAGDSTSAGKDQIRVNVLGGGIPYSYNPFTVYGEYPSMVETKALSSDYFTLSKFMEVPIISATSYLITGGYNLSNTIAGEIALYSGAVYYGGKSIFSQNTLSDTQYYDYNNGIWSRQYLSYTKGDWTNVNMFSSNLYAVRAPTNIDELSAYYADNGIYDSAQTNITNYNIFFADFKYGDYKDGYNVNNTFVLKENGLDDFNSTNKWGIYLESNVTSWFGGEVSADSFTDRTPAPNMTAEEARDNLLKESYIETDKGKKELNHSSLSEFTYKLIPTIEKYDCKNVEKGFCLIKDNQNKEMVIPCKQVGKEEVIDIFYEEVEECKERTTYTEGRDIGATLSETRLALKDFDKSDIKTIEKFENLTKEIKTDKIKAKEFITQTPSEENIIQYCVDYINQMDNLSLCIGDNGKITDGCLLEVEKTSEGSFKVDGMAFVNRMCLLVLAQDYKNIRTEHNQMRDFICSKYPNQVFC